jgi:hypothetical protein
VTADASSETADQLTTTACPGCGAVLVDAPEDAAVHPGASPSCWALFLVTVRGLRDEAGQDAQTAAQLQLAVDTYDAQHLQPGQPASAPVRLCLALEHAHEPSSAAPADRVDAAAPRSLQPPDRWTTTLADLAADLDVVDLPALVRSWADATWADWAPAAPELRRAAATVLAG